MGGQNKQVKGINKTVQDLKTEIEASKKHRYVVWVFIYFSWLLGSPQHQTFALCSQCSSLSS